MGKLALCLALFGLLGCEQLIGLDDLEVSKSGGSDGGGDGDSDEDSDSDGDEQPCTVELIGTVEMDGVCQDEDDPCAGGTNPGDVSGNCPDNLVCCIGDDECDSFLPGGLGCQETSCADEGWPIGCPNGEWCCPLI